MLSKLYTTVNVYIVFSYITVFLSAHGEQDHVHVTKLGSLRGRITKKDSKTIYSYFNIPYAKPPIGSLRFKEPQAYGRWEGVRGATQCGNVCPQDVAIFSGTLKHFKPIYERGPSQSEDCLSLNVIVPGSPKDKLLRSVMVWIHGGAYTVGDGCGYDGSYLASGGDVIVVTFNYRLGALGFFSTADTTMPGNYGLKDQRLALMWVHENIEDFGGDPNSVTIFGESAGGFSVSFMSLMPENKGLFQKAIFQSGTADLLPVIERNPRHVALSVAKELECADDDSTVDDMDSDKILACMSDVPWTSIVEVQESAPTKAGISSALTASYPTIDGTMIKKHPRDILKESNSEEFDFFRSLDVMAGTCNLEGTLVVGIFEMLKAQMNISKDVVGYPQSFACDVALAFAAGSMLGNSELKDLLCEYVKSDSPLKVGQNLVDLFGDIMFVAPTVNMINKHTTNNKKTNTFQYLFSLEAFNGIDDERLDFLKGRGADHFTDIFPLFGKDYGYGTFKERFPYDISDLQRSMVLYWTNFAKHRYVTHFSSYCIRSVK